MFEMTSKGWCTYSYCAERSSKLSLYNVNPFQLSFINDMENFGKYFWGINVYKNILRELDMCKGSPIAIREVHATQGERGSLRAF